jgi:hypothetical protein
MNLTITEKIENLLLERGRMTISQIQVELRTELRTEVSKAVSVLALKHGWRIQHSCKGLIVTTESAIDKSDKVTTAHRKNGTEDTVVPKCVPIDGDWVVTSTDTNSRLYFCGGLSRTAARDAFAKTEKAKYDNVRVRRYHEVKSINAAKNW